MQQPELINQIREFLYKNGFYAYENYTKNMSSNFIKEYKKVATQDNKRTILLDKSWKEITSLGKPRPLLIIELGGSFLKLYDTEISDSNRVNVKKYEKIDFYKNKLYTPEVLFGDIKNHLDSFLEEDSKKITDCIFIFTFPIEQYTREDGYIDAIAIKINKKINHKDIVGINVGETFQKYLRSNGYENIQIAVTNDTVINLLAAKYLEISENHNFDAVLNIIVGTGTNIAAGYDLITDKKQNFYIINTEFGYFKFAPLSRFDKIFNEKVDSKNQSLTEKMISGLWQPQIFKIIIDELIKEQIIPNSTLEIFKTVPLNGSKIETALKNKEIDPKFHDFLNFLWIEQNKRGASICGIAIANIMAQISDISTKPKLDFAIIEVGGVLEKARNYRKKMYETINNELQRLGYSKKVKYNSFSPENASAFGSAVLNTIITGR